MSVFQKAQYVIRFYLTATAKQWTLSGFDVIILYDKEAVDFYTKIGMCVQKTGMEKIL